MSPTPRTLPPTATPTNVPTLASAEVVRTAVAPTAPTATPAAEPSFLGEWDFRADAGTGVIAGTLRFRSDPAGLAGVYVGMRGNATELSNLRVTGNRISFDLVAPRAIWHLDGTLSGDRLEGTFQTAERTIRWTATRRYARNE
jgi:hypothetical protein